MEHLELLHPRYIPPSALVSAWLSRLDLSTNYETENVSQMVTSDWVINSLGLLLKYTRNEREPIAYLETQPEDLAHDSYFHICRVNNNPAAAFARTILSARSLFLHEAEDTQVSVVDDVLWLIDGAFADLLSELFHELPRNFAVVSKWIRSGVRRDANQRWIIGHQIFAGLTQGLIYSFQEMGRSLRAGERQEVRRWAELTISLLRGSEACFLFTADFEPKEYTALIRPSMMPPLSKIGLSGLMSIDHRYLVQLMRDMRPALTAMFEDSRSHHDHITRQLAAVYDSHILVCERFVGNQPSILTGSRSEKSGPSLIGQFKSLRLKPFEHHTRSARLPDAALTKSNSKCPHSQS